MSNIKLDPRKLLGFKIIADGETRLALHSPKIGGKGCPFIAADASPRALAGTLQARIGTKTD